MNTEPLPCIPYAPALSIGSRVSIYASISFCESSLNVTCVTSYFETAFLSAQLNFSTYDIVTSIPQKVTFASLAIAVIGLIWPNINNYWITIPLLLISIACIYTERYAKNIDRYGNRGKENTKQWNDLKILYYKVKDGSDEEGFEEEYKKLEEIGNAFNNSSLVIVPKRQTFFTPLFNTISKLFKQVKNSSLL